MNFWPPKPGFTDITRTRSRSSFTHSSVAGVVAGFSAAPAFTGRPRLPASSRIEVSVRCKCGQASTCTVSRSAPRAANSARYFSGSTIIRCRSSGSRVRLRMASRIGKPIEMFGTNRPSMTSMWIWSAPAASTLAISSARIPKSADRIEGAILIMPSYTPNGSATAESDRGEAVGPVAVGQTADEAGRIGSDRKVGGRVDDEGVVGVEERANDAVVLLRLEGAGGVDEPAAGLHERRRRRQDAALALRGDGDVADLAPPLHLRVPAHDAEAGARRI